MTFVEPYFRRLNGIYAPNATPTSIGGIPGFVRAVRDRSGPRSGERSGRQRAPPGRRRSGPVLNRDRHLRGSWPIPRRSPSQVAIPGPTAAPRSNRISRLAERPPIRRPRPAPPAPAPPPRTNPVAPFRRAFMHNVFYSGIRNFHMCPRLRAESRVVRRLFPAGKRPFSGRFGPQCCLHANMSPIPVELAGRRG